MLQGGDTNAGVYKMKTTLSDFWVFNVREKFWQQIFPNSLNNPGPTDQGQMVTISPDRVILMFGGQYGEQIWDTLWLYNLNNNLWQETNIADSGHLKPGFFYNCTRCEVCEKCKKESTLSAELNAMSAS